jgi:hypothetical protein
VAKKGSAYDRQGGTDVSPEPPPTVEAPSDAGRHIVVVVADPAEFQSQFTFTRSRRAELVLAPDARSDCLGGAATAGTGASLTISAGL